MMTNPQTETIVDGFRKAHSAWRKEVGEVLAPVGKPEAGVWERWAAAHYLAEEFAPRLGRELEVLTALAERLPAQQGAHVWALGELLHFLSRHLCELGPVPQSGPAFAHAINKLLHALDCWCAEAEAVVEAAAGGYAPEIASVVEQVLHRAEMAVPA
jgi:hypothetical protein